ncbi:MAG: hypothetical protein D3910_21900 [Candidatus Electrothrix sp. ATG2]|nr:hypothetical protein [Candidatus Electrothrix sp. ATG2]
MTASNQGNICAAEIIRQDGEALELRDQETGKYNNAVFEREICRKELPSAQKSCGKSWKTPLMEIEGTIRKVEYRTQPQSGQIGLHLDVKTIDKQDVVIHVFPERKTKQCPDLFRFQEKEKVTVVGSEFSTPKHQNNICVAEIIRQDVEPLELNDQNLEMLQPKVLKLRDPITGKHNNSVFNNKKCMNEDGLKSSSLFNWIKNYVGEICKECGDEIVAWDSSSGLLEKCNKCTNKLGWILRAYTGDCTKCQEIACSRCPDSGLPPLCWKNCMESCGGNTGMMSGIVINDLTKILEKWCLDNPESPYCNRPGILEETQLVMKNGSLLIQPPIFMFPRFLEVLNIMTASSQGTRQPEILFPTFQTPTPSYPDQFTPYRIHSPVSPEPLGPAGLQ